MNAKTKKVTSIIINVVLWIFFAFALVMTIVAISAQKSEDGVPSIGGKCYLNVVSDSMKPTFKKGDMIVGDMLSNEEKNNLKVGDVISFYADLDGDGQLEINSHRIVEINVNDKGEAISYKTKGDNVNSVNDPSPVLCQYVICTWSGKKVGGLGALIGAMQTPTIFLCVIVLPLVIVFAYEIFSVVRQISKAKNAGKRQITQEDEELIKQRAVEEYILQQQEAEKLKAESMSNVDNSNNTVEDSNESNEQDS